MGTIYLILISLVVYTQGKSLHSKSFATDWTNAKKSADDLIISIDNFKIAEENFIVVIYNDVIPVIDQIITKLSEFGIPNSELILLEKHVNESCNNTDIWMDDQIVIIEEYKQVVLNISKDIYELNYNNFESDLDALIIGQSDLHGNFLDTIVFIAVEIIGVRDHIFSLTADLNESQQNVIRNLVRYAQSIINGQFMNIAETKAFMDKDIYLLENNLRIMITYIPNKRLISNLPAN